jgi:uncharacterized protein (DUF362 family)
VAFLVELLLVEVVFLFVLVVLLKPSTVTFEPPGAEVITGAEVEDVMVPLSWRFSIGSAA